MTNAKIDPNSSRVHVSGKFNRDIVTQSLMEKNTHVNFIHTCVSNRIYKLKSKLEKGSRALRCQRGKVSEYFRALKKQSQMNTKEKQTIIFSHETGGLFSPNKCMKTLQPGSKKKNKITN